MATSPKTFRLTEQHEAWIEERVESGAFGSASDYIRELIRRDQARERELESLRAELARGEASGLSAATAKDIRDAVRRELKKRGRLSVD